MRSSNQYVDSETWLSDDVSIRERNSCRGRNYERAHETFTLAQALSSTYQPQTNGLVEKQNRTLVSMLRVYCCRYMADWDRYLPQVMGAYNSTQYTTTGISPHMMFTGHEKSLPLLSFTQNMRGRKHHHRST